MGAARLNIEDVIPELLLYDTTSATYLFEWVSIEKRTQKSEHIVI